jgi:hypothetical protein
MPALGLERISGRWQLDSNQRTLLGKVGSAEKGQGTKSLRDSPLRGASTSTSSYSTHSASSTCMSEPVDTVSHVLDGFPSNGEGAKRVTQPLTPAQELR